MTKIPLCFASLGHHHIWGCYNKLQLLSSQVYNGKVSKFLHVLFKFNYAQTAKNAYKIRREQIFISPVNGKILGKYDYQLKIMLN